MQEDERLAAAIAEAKIDLDASLGAGPKYNIAWPWVEWVLTGKNEPNKKLPRAEEDPPYHTFKAAYNAVEAAFEAGYGESPPHDMVLRFQSM